MAEDGENDLAERTLDRYDPDRDRVEAVNTPRYELIDDGFEGENPETDYGKPNKPLTFEINPHKTSWTFEPEHYPSDFTQMKKKELRRFGGNCGSESVSIKKIKNREFNISGLVLRGELNHFHAIVDMQSRIDLISPIVPNSSGMECYVKQGELGNEEGWDPNNRQRAFNYTLDLVSTGYDEQKQDSNAIITNTLKNNSNSEEKSSEDDTETTTVAIRQDDGSLEYEEVETG